MFGQISEFFSYSFALRAMAVGGAVALCAALLGVSLVLKKYSMIGDGLSHVGFAILALSSALGAADVNLVITIPVVIVCAVVLLRITENSSIGGDAAIAVLSTLSLAIGYIAMYKAGTNVDVGSYMFGNMFTIKEGEAYFSLAVAAVVVALFVLFYHKIFAVTFDENFAGAAGVPVGGYNIMIASLTAVTIVLGMRMMGTLLISALIIFPSLTSMRLFKSFRAVVISSSIVSLSCFFVGVVASHIISIPPGSAVVVTNGIVFAVFSLIGFLKEGMVKSNHKKGI
ncbi:MAG: metal ABC transporter permease [Ruminococcaceae bacterium]|nr:metal ABC transporter permease [Oscillospiraceae bacterium]